MIAGCFDPVHEGHIEHIIQASKLGDVLYIVTHPDDIVARVKGKCFIPLHYRIMILRGLVGYLALNASVWVACSIDGTVTETLKALKPNIFAKGGDRTPDNMPESEIEACKEVGCEIRYGIGKQLNSSSRIKEELGKRCRG